MGVPRRHQGDAPAGSGLGAVPTLDLTDLAADIAGALDGTEDRAYRYARQIDLNGVLVSGALVPRGVRAPVMRSADALDHVDRVHAATLITTHADGRSRCIGATVTRSAPGAAPLVG